MASVVLPRTCRQCGAVFDGGPRAWYCPACRIERKKESKSRMRKKGKADRPLGSVDQCTVCGKDYIVKSARQKYCPDCAYEAVRAADRPMSKKWNQEHKETYYPARNAKRNQERKEHPEIIRAKENAYWQQNKDKLAAKNKRAAEKRKAKKEDPDEPPE